ncbi:MAG: hypothetical protein IJ939_03820 [Clostridia bacterium]|nr:hypothetical protein [Clostridia bacterium]
MKITHLPKEVSISISGRHYFGCDYIFANIYGSSVFSDEENRALPQEDNLGEISRDPESGDFSKETLEEFINSDTGGTLDLSTLPDVNKEIEYSTLGTLQSDGKGGYLIRYSGDFTPICIHAQDGKITLNGQEDDFEELVFEKDKRNYICLPESLFLEDAAEENENQSPIMLCLTAECVENNLKEDGGVLHVSYSIEVNGITAEVTDFTLTAVSGQEV